MSRRVVWLLAVLFACSNEAQAQAASDPALASWTLRNARLEVRVDRVTGAVTGLRNRVAGLELLSGAGTAPPWRLEVAGGPGPSPSSLVASFFHREPDGEHLDLIWSTTDPRLVVGARIAALTDGTATFRGGVGAAAPGAPEILALEFPVLAPVGNLGGRGDQVDLVHPVAMGYRINDPARHVRGLPLEGTYPGAFGGCPVQLWSYTAGGKAGFSLEVHDAAGTEKSFPWRLRLNAGLEAAVRWQPWDRGPGKGLDLSGIPVVVRALAEAGWEEAAAAYRKWALRQPWCAAGPLHRRPPSRRPGWLDGLGLATIGISVRDPNQESLFRLYRSLTGLSVLHLGGFWWPAGKPGVEWYGGYCGWHDSRVRAQNVAAARSGGDHLALWLFDLYFSASAPSWSRPVSADPVAPWRPFSVFPAQPSSGTWRFMCPATTPWPAFHGWRLQELERRYQPDAAYYDIGPALAPLECLDSRHGHPRGGGRWMVAALRSMLDAGRPEANKIHGSPVAFGTELMTEMLVDRFDFYYARAGAGPLGMLEMEPFRTGIRQGWAEKVPLFTFVYHDHAPVRLDGNVKLAPELGELFFFSAGRVAVRGGIPIVDHTLSAAAIRSPTGRPERPRPPWKVWYETFTFPYQVYDDTPYALDERRAAFLEDLGRMRTTLARDFLVFGTMRRTPALTSRPAQVTLDYHLYNTFGRRTRYAPDGRELGPEYAEQSVHTVPAVLASAWTAPDGRLGVVLLDVAATRAKVTLDLDPGWYRPGPGPWTWRLRTVGGEAGAGKLTGPTRLDLALEPRRAYLLEVR